MKREILHLPTVTRVEVIDQTGRVYVTNEASMVEVQVQDNGMTLKILLKTDDE